MYKEHTLHTLRKTVAPTIASLVAASSSQGVSNHIVMDVTSQTGGSGVVAWDIDMNGHAEISFSQSALLVSISYVSRTISSSTTGGGTISTVIPAAQLANATFQNLNTTYIVSAGKNFGAVTASIVSTASIGPNQNGFTNGVKGYIGFSFTNDGSNTYYGWASVTLTAFGGVGSVVIDEWAYETVAGSPIQVGAVPEPEVAALGLAGLATGAAGLRRWRNKTRSKAG